MVQWDRAEARATKLRTRLAIDPSSLASLLGKLTTAEAPGGTRAEAEQVALRREISDLNEQIAQAMQERKELRGGD